MGALQLGGALVAPSDQALDRFLNQLRRGPAGVGLGLDRADLKQAAAEYQVALVQLLHDGDRVRDGFDRYPRVFAINPLGEAPPSRYGGLVGSAPDLVCLLLLDKINHSSFTSSVLLDGC